jgi:predicted ATP-dependent serine protease
MNEINKKFLVKIDRKSHVSRTGLKGIKKTKLSSLSGLGVVSSTDLAEMNFKSLPFTGKFKDLIGNPTIPFHIMAYGLPGSGKSTLAIQFAKYLAEKHNMKVLYLAKEEGISGTTQEKFIRLNAIHQNIDIAEKMPENLSNYDVLVIDSVNEMNFTPDNIRQIQTKYPRLSTLQLFKATKEGKFLGQSDFAHLCQAEIKCFEGKAQAQKNRFGGNLEVQILN